MLAFLVIKDFYWAKGKSIDEALKNYHKIIDSPVRSGQKYLLVIYTVKDEKAYEYIHVNDFMEVTRGRDDKQIHTEMVKF